MEERIILCVAAGPTPNHALLKCLNFCLREVILRLDQLCVHIKNPFKGKFRIGDAECVLLLSVSFVSILPTLTFDVEVSPWNAR